MMFEDKAFPNAAQGIDEKKIQLLYMSFYMAWLKFQGQSTDAKFIKCHEPLI